jgi:nitroimidazol reductase NimA-like FMN-containing flavoprotein (pyridoxamine 5'-phosphate oxidase superfamily)
VTGEAVTAHPMLGEDPAAGEDSWFGTARSGAWETARRIVETSQATYWLATVRPDGRPHVMPIMAVWANGMLYFTAGPSTRKARNLGRDSHCVVAVEQEPLDLVIEGSARMTRDDETLRRVAERYATVFDWHVTVRDGAFHDTAGAPTAGPPPYDVYEVTPRTAFGLPVGEVFGPTRWRFGAS